MPGTTLDQLELFLPDRFEGLRRRAAEQVQSIVVPVEAALAKVDELSRDLRTAGRGGFLVLRGDSGSGKSTFLYTLELFRHGVEAASIPRAESIGDVLAQLGSPSVELRLLVVEGREALRDVSREELESFVHEINSFTRSSAGERTLVVWPCNTDDLQEVLTDVAARVGGDALLGVGEPVFRFLGPGKEQYVEIARRTVATLNEGASMLDLGVSEEKAQDIASAAPTIGAYLGLLRQEMLVNQDRVRGLLANEQCRMWIVVAAGTEPDNDVAALTRGSLHSADTDRMMSATRANVVEELRQYPEKIGILSAVLDAKILHLPIIAALATARAFGDARLKQLMRDAGLRSRRERGDQDRIGGTDLARAFRSETVVPRTRGRRPGSNTIEAFQKLAEIARSHDQLLNMAVGDALRAAGLISGYETERDLGAGLTRRTDLVCDGVLGPVRLEVMWRSRTSRAEIANYSLTKLHHYGKAIGLL